MSRNSETGRRLAKRVLRDWLRMLLKRSPKREVIASIGIEMAMVSGRERKQGEMGRGSEGEEESKKIKE